MGQLGLRGDDHEGGPGDAGLLEGVAAELPLRLAVVDGTPRLRPVEPGARGGLAEVLVAVQSCAADGSWPRIKVCSADDCSWAYYDASKNRSRTWCEWGCGNKAKTRSYRARQKAARTS